VSSFSLAGVHVDVVGTGVLADDHPLVHLHPGPDEQLTALLAKSE